MRSKADYFFFFVIGLAFACTLSVVLSVPLPVGADWYFHYDVAQRLASGNVFGAWNFISSVNHNFPYGFYVSTFQFLMVPSVWFNQPFVVAKILQVIFLPTTLALTMYVVKRYHSTKAAVYCGMALFGSWSFFDGAIQVRPESLDLLFYPLMLLSMLTVAKWRFVGLAVFSVYSHGLAGLSLSWGLVANKVREKAWVKPLLVGVVLALPVLIVSAVYFQGALAKWVTFGNAGSLNPQQALFWREPFTFIPYYMGASMFGIPFLFRKGRTQLETLALWGLIGNFIMLPFWADRWLHYIALPLAIFAGVGITKLENPKHRMWFALALITFFVVYVASYFGFSFGVLGKWWQPGN